MSVPEPPRKASWADKLQRIDRRILYLLLLVVIAIPTLVPVTVPNVPLPMSRDLWTTIDSTPPGKVVLLSSTWSRSTRGENRGQMTALLNHLMTRRIPFIVSSFDPKGSQVAKDTVTEMAPRYNYVYGVDWAQIPFQVSAANFVKGINVDFIGTVKTDNPPVGVAKQPLQNLPLFARVKSVADIWMVVEISASASQGVWIQFLNPGVKVGFCPTSVMAPESLPYYSSKQLAGVLWGAKGAYDYEQLNDEAFGKLGNGHVYYGTGRQYMGPLSAAFALIILSIVVGNLAMYASRRAGQREA